MPVGPADLWLRLHPEAEAAHCLPPCPHPALWESCRIVEHYVRDYLVERFGEQIAEDIKPLEIQKWLKSLNEANGLAWMTISKIRGIMLRIYKIGLRHELVAKNPLVHVETRSKSNYRAIVITPAQTLGILRSLPSPRHFALVLTCAATAVCRQHTQNRRILSNVVHGL